MSLFFKINFICFEMHMDRPIKSENTFGTPSINYLSICPFMCHPRFSTRKASKLHCVRGQSGFYNLALTEENMQNKFDLKLSVYSLGVDI